jgi:hypothetical protein
MTENSYTASFTVPQSPADVYDAVRDPRSWWNADITGPTDAVGDEFTHEVPGLHNALLRITVADPGRRVVWHVLGSVMSFLEDDKGEWVGTDIVFDIEAGESGTTLRFTHDGLVPAHDCFEICESAWGGYIASLHELITTGVGRPNQERKPA